MTTRAQKQQKTKGSKILTYAVLIVVAIMIGTYWYYTKDESAETYKIKPSGSEDFYGEKSYINLTGKETEEKKIKLSEDYWTNGKFNFK